MAGNTNIVEFKEGWKDMQEGIKKVKMILEGRANSQFSSDEYMKLYTTIYNMSTQTATYNCCFQLYNKYKETFVEYIASTVLPCLREKHDEFLLMEFVKRWSNHKVMIKWLCRFFSHLDRYYTVLHAYTMLNDAAIICFRDLAYKEIHVKVRDAVITVIGKEREGEQIDRALLKNALGIFLEIDLGKMERYEQDFEAYLLEETAAYYSRKASKWIVEDSFPDYMLKCEECLNKERDRVSHYLHSSSETKLIDAVQHELLVLHLTALLIDKEHSGCIALLRHDKVEDLSRMFRLCCKIPKGLEPIAKIFHKHIIAECTALFQQAKADEAATNQASNVAFIWKVIELHDKYMVHVTDCFQNHSLLHKALTWAFKVFFNKTVKGRSSAEHLVNFCDNILLKKGGAEKLSDEAIEETLEKVVNMVDYIDDKDFFAEFHRKKLACRLLSDRPSANEDLERSILINLKQQLGAHFTAKMEGMLTDMTLAWEYKLSFEDYLWNNSSAEHPKIDLTISVLTARFWPSYTTFNLNPPPEMLKWVQAFESFYKTKSRNKKLVWLYSQGTCIVNGNFEQIPIELVLSTYQAAVLLLFNDSDRLSYSEIVEQLDLPHDHGLTRVLHSLSCSKYKILFKEPNTNSISNSDIFVFNSKFTDRMRRRRIKIPLPSIEEQKVVQHVDHGRRYAIECVIVRIMKSRKVLEQRQLISECIKQLSSYFKPDVETIKTQIDYLITRGFLERDQKEPNMFKYLP